MLSTPHHKFSQGIVLARIENRRWLAWVIRANLALRNSKMDGDLLVSLHLDEVRTHPHIRKIRLAEALIAMITVLALCAAWSAPARAADLFPFVLPWDDATPTITDLSTWNDAPAGRDGFVIVKDGHLFAGKKRWRIFG